MFESRLIYRNRYIENKFATRNIFEFFNRIGQKLTLRNYSLNFYFHHIAAIYLNMI